MGGRWGGDLESRSISGWGRTRTRNKGRERGFILGKALSDWVGTKCDYLGIRYCDQLGLKTDYQRHPSIQPEGIDLGT